ncbi:Ion transport protein-domain-containing protein [Catenaria anguillulae PL171]|uniref:Ion transport protein-domain-containing protein n=1 Tax=Catenaria anguillulae PL171 TaxID=765915 RepID=A0A1Y2HLC5_9FUNG|nr:Ion transport protein-domain-containing protein [Catenaria anguillulae PL171]
MSALDRSSSSVSNSRSAYDDVASISSQSSGGSFLSTRSSNAVSASLRIASSRSASDSTANQTVFLLGLAESSWMRQQCYRIVSHGLFSSSILLIIVLNTILLAVQTTPYLNANYGWYLSLIDQIFLGIYLMETITKIYVYHFGYFRSGWNNFDFIIVATSIFSWALPYVLGTAISFNPRVLRLLRVFRAFRAVRSLRALRAISFLRSLQTLVQTLLQSIPAMSSIVSLAALVLYIFAVIARSMYASVDPERFGTLGSTFFRLFSVLTLDEWSDIYMDNRIKAPDMFLFLFIFIVLESFVFLNLFVAVIVSNLDQLQSKSRRNAPTSSTSRATSAASPSATAAASGRPTTAATATVRIHALDPALRESMMGSVDLKAEPDGIDDGRPSGGGANSGGQPLQGLFDTSFGIDNYYPPHISGRTKKLLGQHFMLSTTLEKNLENYRTQVQVLDDLVDLVKNRDGFVERF